MSYSWLRARRANSLKSGAVCTSTGCLSAPSSWRRSGWYISRMTRALVCGATPRMKGRLYWAAAIPLAATSRTASPASRKWRRIMGNFLSGIQLVQRFAQFTRFIQAQDLAYVGRQVVDVRLEHLLLDRQDLCRVHRENAQAHAEQQAGQL